MIETPRLVLRRLRESDLDAYAALVGDAEVMRFVGAGRPATAREAARSLAAIRDRFDEDGFGVLGIERRADGRLVGRAGSWIWDPADWTPGHARRTLGDRAEVELGWALLRSAWGHGFATEAARGLLDHAFRELGLTRLISLIHPENDRSLRVAHRLGATHEADVQTARWGPAHLFVHAENPDLRTGGPCAIVGAHRGVATRGTAP